MAGDYGGELGRKGRLAEEKCRRWLLAQPGVYAVEDLRDDPRWWKADVDFLVRHRDGFEEWTELVEVKYDDCLGRTSNVLWELAFTNNDAAARGCCQTLGWSSTSKADWLMFYAQSNDSIYLCRMDDYREAYQEHVKRAREVQVRQTKTDENRTVFNVLIPLAECEHIFTKYPLSEAA